MSSFPNCEHLRERDYFDPGFDLSFDPHDTHWCRYYSRNVIPFDECSPACPGFMPWQQAKAARPKGDIAAPYVPTQASSQSVRALQYQFDKLTKQFQTIFESLPPIDGSNPTVPLIQLLEERVSPLEDAQQHKQAEIDAEFQRIYNVAVRIYNLLQTRKKSLHQTIAQRDVRIRALDDARDDAPEWIKEKEDALSQREQAREDSMRILGVLDFTSTMSGSKTSDVRYIFAQLSDPSVQGMPHSTAPHPVFERLSRILKGDSQLASLQETYESARDRIQRLTTERAAIGHQIYLIKVKQNLDDMKSQLHRDIEHRKVVQSIYDTLTSRGSAALARHTVSVSNSTVGSMRQFFYEAEKILNCLLTSRQCLMSTSDDCIARYVSCH